MKKTVTVLLLFALSAYCYANKKNYTQAFQKSIKLEKQKKYSKAIQVLTNFTKIYNKDYNLFIRLGWLYFQIKEYKKAKKNYSMAFTLAQYKTLAKLGIAWCDYSMGQYRKAKISFENILKLYPKNKAAQKGVKLSQKYLKENMVREKAKAYEKKEMYKKAIREVKTLLQSYPKNFDLNIWLGWLYFQAKKYYKAKEYYQNTLKINNKSEKARVGLAWSFYYLGDKNEAKNEFQATLVLNPENKSALDGINALDLDEKESFSLTTSLKFSYTFYSSSHPVKDTSWSIEPSAFAVLYEKFSLALTYRYISFSSKTFSDDFSSSEIFVTAGYNDSRFGMNAHYCYIDNSDNNFDNIHGVGGSGRLSGFWGDFILESNISFYNQDENIEIFRLGTSWTLPQFIKHVGVNTGFSYQHSEGEDYFNASMTVFLMEKTTLLNSNWALWVGGKYGNEFRPVYMIFSSIYGIPEEIEYGIWAGAKVNFTENFVFGLHFEYVELEFDDTPLYNASMFTIGGSINLTF